VYTVVKLFGGNTDLGLTAVRNQFCAENVITLISTNEPIPDLLREVNVSVFI